VLLTHAKAQRRKGWQKKGPSKMGSLEKAKYKEKMYFVERIKELIIVFS
jgi:hypothetical protein